jgi:outer membrane protein assembly factor BamA
MQPSLGGQNTLRGFADYRFHDRNALLVTAEARFALMTHVDLATFWDAGNVAERFGDLDLDKRSWGMGFRLHSRRETFARFDMAHSEEGWKFLFRLNDPLHLSRLTKRTAPVPFVP